MDSLFFMNRTQERVVMIDHKEYVFECGGGSHGHEALRIRKVDGTVVEEPVRWDSKSRSWLPLAKWHPLPAPVPRSSV